jgi:hypothetical protein
MIIPVASVIAVLLPVLFGGRLVRLADLRLRAVPLIVATLLVQVLILEILSGPLWLLRLVHVATYVTAGLFMWTNRRIPGALPMGLGAASNGITIALNDGVLPAGAWAMRVSGLTPHDSGFVNSAVESHPRLWFLGDVFPIPAALPLSNVFSVGDVLVVAGLAYASFRICGTRWTEPWRGAAAPDTVRAEGDDVSATGGREDLRPTG